jgi:hypothetical protein
MLLATHAWLFWPSVTQAVDYGKMQGQAMIPLAFFAII